MSSTAEVETAPLYARLLGPDWDRMEPPVQRAHKYADHAERIGEFDIVHGSGPLARRLARWLRFPPAGRAVPTRLRLSDGNGREHWQRMFGNVPVESVQYACGDRVLAERFGPIEFTFHLEARTGGIVYRQHDAVLCAGHWRLRLPARLGPRITAEEMPWPARPDATHVHVTLRAPLLGVLLDYDGVMDAPPLVTGAI